jgi:AbrB family looped-hinge helix DNA binding protein
MIKEEMKVGPKGQVVIPKAFRKSLGLHPGTKVVFTLREDGILLEKPREDAATVFKEIAESGKSVRIKPHEYVEELEKRFK